MNNDYEKHDYVCYTIWVGKSKIFKVEYFEKKISLII